MAGELATYAKDKKVKFFLFNFTDLFGTQRTSIADGVGVASDPLIGTSPARAARREKARHAGLARPAALHACVAGVKRKRGEGLTEPLSDHPTQREPSSGTEQNHPNFEEFGLRPEIRERVQRIGQRREQAHSAIHADFLGVRQAGGRKQQGQRGAGQQGVPKAWVIVASRTVAAGAQVNVANPQPDRGGRHLLRIYLLAQNHLAKRRDIVKALPFPECQSEYSEAPAQVDVVVPANAEPPGSEPFHMGSQTARILGMCESGTVDCAHAHSADHVEPVASLCDQVLAGPDLPTALGAAA